MKVAQLKSLYSFSNSYGRKLKQTEKNWKHVKIDATLLFGENFGKPEEVITETNAKISVSPYYSPEENIKDPFWYSWRSLLFLENSGAA